MLNLAFLEYSGKPLASHQSCKHSISSNMLRSITRRVNYIQAIKCAYYTTTASKPAVQCFFHKGSSTAQYVVACQDTGACAVIDPVMDYNAAACKTSNNSVEEICQVRYMILRLDVTI